MRIAVITNAYPPEARGGAGFIAAALVELWRESGHEVRVWTSYADWLTQGVLARLYGHLLRDRGAAAVMPEVYAWKPELLVTHNLTGIGWATGRAAQARGIRWMHVLHDVQLFEPSGQLFEDRITVWQRFWAGWRQRVFGSPDRVISPTDWLLAAHERRGFVFVDSLVIVNPAPKAAAALPSPATLEPSWLFVGRLSTDKGADIVLELARRRPTELFTCIGDGPLKATLEQQKNVRCLGVLSPSDVQSVMMSAFALLMPSRLQENQPTVLLEAWTCGLPVIASLCGGIPETVGDAGLLVPLDVSLWMEACDRMQQERPMWIKRAKEWVRYFDRARVQAVWQRIILS